MIFFSSEIIFPGSNTNTTFSLYYKFMCYNMYVKKEKRKATTISYMCEPQRACSKIIYDKLSNCPTKQNQKR